MVKTPEWETCPHCGNLLRRQRLSGREIVINSVCAAMALSMVYCLCRVADHWLTIEFGQVRSHMLWQDPFFDSD